MNLDELKFDDNGLIPVVVQDSTNGRVLMVAYGNKESIQKTIDTRKTHFWSRSRHKLWMKGEESGNTQDVESIRFDCDRDTLLVSVHQNGVACHTGEATCFYTDIEGTKSQAPAFGNDRSANILKDVYEVILDRKRNAREGSYVSGLFEKGVDKISKKIGEEAGETIIGAKNNDREEITYEVADLWFHCMVLLAYFDLGPDDIMGELQKRFGKTKDEYGRD